MGRVIKTKIMNESITMAIKSFICWLLFMLLAASYHCFAITHKLSSTFNRTSFPADFVFGAASASYQYEGAVKEGGRGVSIWDTFTHDFPEKILDRSNGDIALDFYHRYKEDVKIMKDMGLKAFRFSISWSRILPGGKLSGGINKEGIQFYKNLIDELLSKGIEPYATLFHWDLPQALEDEYGGFLSPRVANDFKDFAEVCYKEFGEKVKNWITLNEPWTYCNNGYDLGRLAPGRCSAWRNNACKAGNSSTEPYLAAHHMLLSHAAAVKVYKHKYQGSQKGKIGITLVSQWMIPYSNTTVDKKAAKRAIDFMFGWFMDPLAFGTYPKSMRTYVGNRLPKFTTRQSKMIKGSFDFLGLNYYTSSYAADIPLSVKVNISFTDDQHINFTSERNGVPIGPHSDWVYAYPKGIKDLLVYIKKEYNNPTIYITENGINEIDNKNLTLEQALHDPMRIDYHNNHLSFISQSIKHGVDVKAYFVWSLFDTFEWNSGFIHRYGMNFIDYKNGLKRYPKDSSIWFKKFLTVDKARQ